MNRLSSTAIGSKTLLNIWSDGAAQDYDLLHVLDAQDYDLLRVFGYLTYFSAKDGKLNLRVKKFVFLGLKKNMKDYKL